MLWNFVLFALAVLSVSAQTISTVTDANNGGATEVVSISTDAAGNTFTQVISTITGDTATTTSSSTTVSIPSPTVSGTAAPPFSSFVVISGTIIDYSDYTKTGGPTSATTSTASKGAAAPTLGAPPLGVPVALMGGVGIALAML